MRYLAYSVILSMFGYGLGESSLHELKSGTEKEASTNRIYFLINLVLVENLKFKSNLVCSNISINIHLGQFSLFSIVTFKNE